MLLTDVMDILESKKKKFSVSRLYVITDFKRWSEEESSRIKEACRGGADIIQLRSKTLDRESLMEAGSAIRNVTAEEGVLFIVNDDPELALAVDADGVHLGQGDISISAARKIFGKKPFLIGKSTHNVRQAIAAEKEGADYIGIGPIFSTPTKPNYGAVGLPLIKEVKNVVRIPSVAIGGIDASCIPSVMKAGAERVAVVRAIFGAADVYEAAQQLKEAILRGIER